VRYLPAILLLHAFAGQASADTPVLKSSGEPQVIYHQASPEIFPESWRRPKVNAMAEPLEETERERCRKIVDRALGKYPADLLKATLKKLYCLGQLEYRGAVTGGTRSRTAIYVVCKPSYASTDVERIIHAEYSSVLFQKFPQHFDAKSWNAINPTDFRYLGGGVQAVKAGLASRRSDEAMQAQGFILEYAKASIEEDFNCHAAPLFMGDAQYWQAVEKHSKLKAKSDLVIGFYSKVHASLTKERFQALRAAEAKATADAPKLTLARIFTDKDFEEEKLGAIRWSKLGGHYFSLETTNEGKLGKDLVKHDAATGEKTVIASALILTPKGEKKPLSIDSYAFSADETQVLLFANTKKVWRNNTRGDYWLLNVAEKTLRKLGGDAEPSTMMFAKFSPDGTCVAYVRKNNLHVQSVADLTVTTLTKDGSDTIINGTSDWVNEEELGLRDAFRWSPDGRSLLFWQFDTQDVTRFSMLNQADSKTQRFTTFPYPTAGEKNSATRLGVIDAHGGEVQWLDIAGDPREHYLPKADWTPDGRSVLVQQFNRLQNTLKVVLADPVTGKTKLVLTETDKAWVENKNEIVWIGNDFLWLSERSGWRHAYRVSLDGAVKPITKGEFDLIEVARVDAKSGALYFLASPDNATQRYLYRIGLEGGEAVRLSPADQPGTHGYDIAEDAKWAVHTHSSMSSPPVIQLVSLPEHQTIRVLRTQKTLSEKLAKLKLPKTEFLRVDIGKGITLDGWMMSPPNLDMQKTHPLLMHVYGEPAGQTVKDAWSGQRFLWHAMLAQQGYIVASVDTRGTPAPKGRDWRRAVYRQLGIMNSAEEAAAVQALLKRHAHLDPKRVGIWGWSGGGGSSSLDALFRYPDLYKTAMAVAPVADRTLYDSIYEERYMGLPKDNAEGYKVGSPIAHAKQLKGDLLLIHGTGDDNVHYRGTEMLMNELIAHNKPFTIMPYPNRDHSINTGKGISRHLYELMTGWLQKHLPTN
jgi:dipeptidyl-peptidase 4